MDVSLFALGVEFACARSLCVLAACAHANRLGNARNEISFMSVRRTHAFEKFVRVCNACGVEAAV